MKILCASSLAYSGEMAEKIFSRQSLVIVKKAHAPRIYMLAAVLLQRVLILHKHIALEARRRRECDRPFLDLHALHLKTLNQMVWNCSFWIDKYSYRSTSRHKTSNDTSCKVKFAWALSRAQTNQQHLSVRHFRAFAQQCPRLDDQARPSKAK